MSKRACAIYTRKSTEEGLEQNFNSLHAQREACEAFVLSQAGEGWTASVTRYDDGGFSGGSIERPGLKALLADVTAGKVDIVVVYKVDRLTRSLMDFAKIVEAFDAKGVSFVSVTQAFNTTTSMGRLTLNVLLSFAQFEREVTGERIRDKIAASKAKGLWMGGRPPLGYDAVNQKLVPNQDEADLVRSIFRRYLEEGSVVKLLRALAAAGARSKSWTTKKGCRVEGAVFSRGSVGYLLRNDVYRGAIRHGKLRCWNAHPAIIDEDLWHKVQTRLDGATPKVPTTPKRGGAALLKGRIFNDAGGAMQPIHANRHGRRYRYYVSASRVHGDDRPPGSLPRISALAVEQLVMAEVEPRLVPSWLTEAPIEARVFQAIKRVTLGAAIVAIDLEPDALLDPSDACVTLSIRLKHRQGASILAPAHHAAPIAPKLDRALVRAVSLARRWRTSLESGESQDVKSLASRLGLCPRHTGRILPLAYLAPDLIQMILEGRQPAALSLQALTRTALPLAWPDQRRLIASLA